MIIIHTFIIFTWPILAGNGHIANLAAKAFIFGDESDTFDLKIDNLDIWEAEA
jgi:hypothetical protein